MVFFFNRTNFNSKNQYGFRKGLNTEIPLINFMDIVTEVINNQKCVSELFMDIKKSFDTVEHSILLDKLYNCGFRGVENKWLSSYLSNDKSNV